MSAEQVPFHAGELQAQWHANAGDVAAFAGGFIRDHMPAQHRDFFGALPFLVVAGQDEAARTWVTILEGPEGFAHSPDPRRLVVHTMPKSGDPLAGQFRSGAAIGIVGIDLATRRRNRLNGRVGELADGFAVEVRQSFGNCPQYIHERILRPSVVGTVPPPARRSPSLSSEQCSRIAAADTLFIGSGFNSGAGGQPDGFDASHRGGPRGFVEVTGDGRLLIPDYAGNKYFNTIGNLLKNPRVGLLWTDFATGGMLHVTGRARIHWDAEQSSDPNALRVIEVSVDEVVERPGALALRWDYQRSDRRRLKIVDKVQETAEIVSFRLAADDDAPLAPFEAGQYLPIELAVPGQEETVARTYSLSGPPDAGTYRLTVKREAHGTASTFLHDDVDVGDVIMAGFPAGDFTVPEGIGPLVLVSAGVGVTPMLPMLYAVTAETPKRPVWFIQSARNGQSGALMAEVELLARKNANVTRSVHFSAPTEADRTEGTFDRTGRITAADLLALPPGPGAEFLLCGPSRFIADIRSGLEAGGISPDRIHVETFGPAA